MKIRQCLAAASICAWLTVPASANTVATFTLDGVTFDDGSHPTGSFDANITSGAVTNINITGLPQGYDFTNAFAASVGAVGDSMQGSFFAGPPPQFLLVLAPFNSPGGADLILILAKASGAFLDQSLTTTNVVLGASFPIYTFEGSSGFAIGKSGNAAGGGNAVGGTEVADVTGGFLDVTAVSTTPLPAALPLFATGLAGLGWFARRRRKQAVA
jgi:hypothetical protein